MLVDHLHQRRVHSVLSVYCTLDGTDEHERDDAQSRRLFRIFWS